MKLGIAFVETNLALIVSHLVNDVVSQQRNTSSRYEVLLFRRLVGVLLRYLVGVRMLSDGNDPAAGGRVFQAMTSDDAGTGVVRQRASSSAECPGGTLLHSPIPPYTYCLKTASWALRCFCYSTPLHIPRTVLVVVDKLQRARHTTVSPPSCLSSLDGLYVSFDASAKVFDMATQLLEHAGEYGLKITAPRTVEERSSETDGQGCSTCSPNRLIASLLSNTLSFANKFISAGVSKHGLPSPAPFEAKDPPYENAKPSSADVFNKSCSCRTEVVDTGGQEAALDILDRKSILSAVEHDPLSLCQAKISEAEYELGEQPPLATAVVDTAIEPFSRILRLQDYQTMHTSCRIRPFAEAGEEYGARGSGFVNATVALVLTSRYGSARSFRQAKHAFGNGQSTSLLSPFLIVVYLLY
ncbi:hypothetical protein NLJ89_g8598 [Agrocybe chaxingu]|uniref:Uncharacterized protein n=1 Tax=Agrocybe chaxingu TaxID=84603 RepID=A0A9W8JSC6_9AGAR|nr:hypothetical protein NLJ89_g8598 [Agrocybe chaxingu]